MRFVLCDDNEQHNEFLGTMLRQIIGVHSLDAEIALTTTASSDLLAYAAQNTGETVYFLDLDLGPEGSGLALAQAIREKDPRSYIVYVSAHLELAIECLRTKASDFLVKPFLFAQLEQCVLGIMRDHTLMQDEANFQINSGSVTYIIPQRDVFFFEKQREYVLATTSDSKYRWRENYESLFERIDDQLFQQIHKGYLVNIQHIQRYDRRRRLVYLTNGTALPVSRGFQASFEGILRKGLHMHAK